MKNVLKRNQIIILVIALMLVSAGYLNYSGNKTAELLETGAQSIEQNGTEYAGIGDAKLVSSNAVEADNEQVAIVPNEENNDESNANSDTINSSEQIGAIVDNSEQAKQEETENSKGTATNASLNNSISNTTNNTNANAVTDNSLNNTITVPTSNTATKEIQEYFSSSRLTRETMYSQMIESYQKILASQTISETQKAIAQTEIQNINAIKNKIMICENLIKTKGFSDLIIFVNDKSISVVVRADNLEQEQIAQIQNIIAREMNAEVGDIHISNK